MRRIAAVVLLALAVIAAVACSSAGSSAPEGSSATTSAPATTRYPAESWEHVDPADAGFDPAALSRLDGQAGAAGSSCLVVTRDGAVVDEQYWGGATTDTQRQAFSSTKSVTSVLFGIAQDHGSLSFDQPAADFIEPWQGTPADQVTIRDILSNDSGRHWDLVTDYKTMAVDAKDKTAFAIGLAQDHARVRCGPTTTPPSRPSRPC